MSSQENRPGEPPRRPRGRPRLTTPGQYSPGLPRDHPMQSLPPTARSILEAARRVLAERGLEGLTIEAVANEANVSRTLIPYHFGSRAGLVAILFDSLFHDLAVSVYGLAGPGGSLPTFLDWIKREADDVQSQHDFFELIVSALREPELARRIAALYDDYRELTLEMTGVASRPSDEVPAGQRPTGAASSPRSARCSSPSKTVSACRRHSTPTSTSTERWPWSQTMIGDALARLEVRPTSPVPRRPPGRPVRRPSPVTTSGSPRSAASSTGSPESTSSGRRAATAVWSRLPPRRRRRRPTRRMTSALNCWLPRPKM